MASNGTTKRRQPADVSIGVGELPEVVLSSIVGHLTKTEVAFFAASLMDCPAITAQKKRTKKKDWPGMMIPSVAGEIVLACKPTGRFRNNSMDAGYDWQHFDFFGIEKSLAARLSDGDVKEVLLCIDAANKLKKLKLIHCVGIIGSGLEPLRGSTVIEQIDLSLVRSNQRPLVRPEPAISTEAILPILDSIIGTERHALKHLQLPKKWFGEQSPQLELFLAKYNRVLNGRELACTLCTEVCRGDWMCRRGENFGQQDMTCYSCLSQCCISCDEEGFIDAGTCEDCEKRFCSDCGPVMSCDGCNATSCFSCTLISRCFGCFRATCMVCSIVTWCDGCNQLQCLDCAPSLWCKVPGCARQNCVDCAISDLIENEDSTVQSCVDCESISCGHHLVKDVALWVTESHDDPEGNFCSNCIDRAVGVLQHQNKNIRSDIRRQVEKIREQVRIHQETVAEEFHCSDFSELLEDNTMLIGRRAHLNDTAKLYGVDLRG